MRIESILSEIEHDRAIVPAPMREWWDRYFADHRERYILLLRFLERHRLGGRILEVGSTPGHFTALLKHQGYDITGVDIAPERVAEFWTRHGIVVHKADIEREALPFAPRQFDAVLFTEVLEHLRVDPLHALREIHRVLREGGRIILSTPNITPADRVRFLFNRDYQGDPVEEFGKLERLGHMGHVRLYSVREVERFLSATGFRTLKRERLGRPAGWMDVWLLAQLWMWIRRDAFAPFLYVLAEKQ